MGLGSLSPRGNGAAVNGGGVGLPCGPGPNGNNGNRASLFETTAGIEMVQYLLETESRALILFNVESVPSELLRVACEKLGCLAYLRTDFRAGKGVVFLAYDDLRAAIVCMRLDDARLYDDD